MLVLFSVLTVLSVYGCIDTLEYSVFPFEEKKWAKEEVVSDLRDYLEFIENTHPNLEYTINRSAFDSTSAVIRNEITEGMSTREVWYLFARLHPLFNDAHVGLKAPVKAFKTFREDGGKSLPSGVQIKGTRLFISPAPNDANDKSDASHEILSINGIAAKNIIQELQPRMRGESPDLQNFVMQRRFETFFWVRFGAYTNYIAEIKKPNGDKYTMDFSMDRSQSTGTSSPSEDNFVFTPLENGLACITINTFGIDHKDEFLAFLEKTFEQISNESITDLIIDIRKNGGGAHDLSDPLLSYLTQEKYTQTSKITARITPKNIKRLPGATLGDVLTVPFPQWVTPEPQAHGFNGNVYVMISERTYSQAIAFATIVQDFSVGTVVGEITAGRANQTGQVQTHELKNTGLTAYAPIYIFHRAKVRPEEKGVVPDVVFVNDPVRPETMLQKLKAHILANR